MTNLQELYDGMEDVIDIPTRKVLYIQFIHKYYPKAYEALMGHNKLVIPNE